MKRPVHELVRAACRGWDVAERLILALLASGMVALALVQIILRNFFKTGLVWAEPLLGMLLLWLTMFGALAATGARRHININLAEHLFPPRLAAFLLLVTHLFAALVCALLSRAGFRFCLIHREIDATRLLGIPDWVYLLVIPVCLALMAYRFALQSVAGWVRHRREGRLAGGEAPPVAPMPGGGP